MDYRTRKYYLVKFYRHNECINIIKREIPSVKIHPPYNHYRNDKAEKIRVLTFKVGKDLYDTEVCGTYVQAMISCPKIYNCILDSLFRCIRIYHDPCIFWKEVTKEELKQ